jgi:hypothetical protein
MPKRLVAVLVAAALVAGAFAVRAWLDRRNDDDGSTGPTTSVNGSTTVPGAQTVICVSELAAACDALQAKGFTTTVEPAGATKARLETADATPPDAWVTLYPWPQLVDDARRAKDLPPLFPQEPIRVATSPLALIGPKDRVEVLGQACGGGLEQVTWKCIGDQAGTAWGTLGGDPLWNVVTPGHASPVDSAAGLAVFASAVVSYFGHTDLSTIDFDSDDGFQAWVARLEGSIPDFGNAATTPLDTMLVQPRYDIVGTTDAEIAAKAGAKRDSFTVLYPAPMAQADAVIVSPNAPPSGLVDEVSAALTANGWKAPSGDVGAGLPSPGALEALQLRWKDLVR